MKKFALFAMLICAGLVSFGCSEKKKETPKTDTTQSTTDTEKKDTPAEPAK
ncbi:MAG: hypothetical protein ABSA26_15170 [Thermoguttaceae bacterium]|jgi:ABC-type glycerol-3-phosphate transport system substrate-binding protein